MADRDVKITGWLIGVAGGLALAGLGVVFIRLGLAEAHKLAGALGIFINVTGLTLSIYSVLMTRRSLDQIDSTGATAPGEICNTIHGGQFGQPVVQARDVRELTFGNREVSWREVAAGTGPEQTGQVGQATGGQS